MEDKRIEMTADSLFDVPPEKELQLVEYQGDDLATSPADVPIHDWQKAELDRRKASLTSRPASAVSWEDVKVRIRSRHGH